MEESTVLYVKSKKFEQVQWAMPQPDHYCTAGYQSSKTDFVLDEEDKKVVEMLERTGIPYTLVDLCSTRAIARLKARIGGISTTPTLIFQGQKLEGLEQITSALKTLAASHQR